MNSFNNGLAFLFADDGRPSLDIWKIVGPFFDNFCIGKFPPFENPVFSVSVGLAYSFWTQSFEKKKKNLGEASVGKKEINYAAPNHKSATLSNLESKFPIDEQYDVRFF